jgi:hypothetical protein
MRLPHSPKPLAQRRAVSCMKSLGIMEPRSCPTLRKTLQLCLKDVAQHSIGPTFPVPRLHCRHRVFKGAHCGRDCRKDIACPTTKFLFDFGLGLMLLKLLTTYVNTITFVQTPHFYDCNQPVFVFPSPQPPDRRNNPHPQATAV